MAGIKQISIPSHSFDGVHAGVTTAAAVHRGILLSVVGAVNEINRRHPNFELILTGGDASLLAQHVSTTVSIEKSTT